MDAEIIIELLGLKPHPEGGYYRETYRSDEKIPRSALPSRYAGDRNAGTAIYYMLTPETFSAMHRIKTDEIFHFYLGDPVTMLQLHPDGRGETITLGGDIEAGHCLQCVVPKNVWQGMCLDQDGKFTLMGTTVAPGFDFDDFEIGNRDELIKKYPEHKKLINRLTKQNP